MGNYDLKKYFLINNNHLPIMGSRGCPYNCTYCSNHASEKNIELGNMLDSEVLKV